MDVRTESPSPVEETAVSTEGRRTRLVPSSTEFLTGGLLRLMAANFNHRRSLRRWLTTADGWIEFSVAARTQSGSMAHTIHFTGGRAHVSRGVSDDASVTLTFRDDDAVRDLVFGTPDEGFTMLMRNRMQASGNLAYLSLFNFLTSLLQAKRQRKALARQTAERAGSPDRTSSTGRAPIRERLEAKPGDAVRFLDEPFLARYSLDDFPRLARFLDHHFETMAEICAERPQLLTAWHREHGYEVDEQGRPWNPVLRQALAFKHLMEHRVPLVRKDDLLGGTTTAKDVGVVLYPDSHGTMIWGELLTVTERPLNPYRVSPETIEVLHHDVFPYWADRSFREWVRREYDNPLGQQLDERFAVYFMWKTAALSHTIPDFPKLLRLGARGVMAEINDELAADEAAPAGKRDTLTAMRITLEGLVAYAHHVSEEARRQARECTDARRRAELERIAESCERAPEHPARTLHEAVQAVWLAWIGMHMENTNAGLSLGRLDQWFQPYFEADLAAIDDADAREDYVRSAIELLGCFYLRTADHLPLVPDIGNYLFGGSSSDQAITLGGLTPEGESGVNDLTYVLLKVTEMLKLRDPNVNARYSIEKNSEDYLRRLCEVNLVTTATPSLHGDENVIASLAPLGYPIEHARDWSATGCVEPTLSGKHLGHTNSMMFSLVAPLEMALYDGLHPLMDWKVGPATGDPAAGAFATFDDFFDAFHRQTAFLVEQSLAYNAQLAEAHAVMRPTPFLSSLIEGTIATGQDVTRGGALHNSSGVACIGLTDVVDSLMAIKRLVYDEGTVSFADLLTAIGDDFAGHDRLHALLTSQVPKFGSGDPEALSLADRVAGTVHREFSSHRNFRGGPYTTGFWSMSNHVAFGTLAGALPSGRRAGKAFTPGLTPAPEASPNLLDNLCDVAALDKANLDNNVAFNVKYVPAASDSHERTVENMAAYARGYFDLGGMQMQLNVVSSDTLRDAMAHPENYRDLLVRISGYNAYFVTLNRDMQIELIERAEYGSS